VYVCTCVCVCVCAAENKVAIAAVPGAIASIVVALQKHIGHAPVVRCACGALSVLSAKNGTVQAGGLRVCWGCCEVSCVLTGVRHDVVCGCERHQMTTSTRLWMLVQ